MNHRLIATAVFTFCVGWPVTPAAHGQYSRTARIDRPSDRAASARMGWTGGPYTRQYGATALSGLGGGGWGGPTGRGLPAINRFGAAWRLGGLPPAPIPQAFTLGQVGYRARDTRSRMLRWQGAVTDSELRRVSRFEQTTQLWVPLTGAGPFHLRLSDRPYYAPQPQGTAFHEFFRLEPTEAEAAPTATIAFDSLAGILEQENERFIQQTRSRALEAFKAATTADVEEGAEALSKAQGLLTAVRDLDPEAYVPSLLLIHTTLAKSQIRLAVRQLSDAVRRRPAVFIERPDIASYFGDPKFLEEQMRAHLWIGDDNPAEPGAYALQAYCAWVLNDRTRLRDALAKMSTADQLTEADAKITAVRYAFMAAAQ